MESNDRPKSESGGEVVALLGLAAAAVAAIVGVVKGGKKAKDYLKDRKVEASCELSPEGGCFFFVKVKVRPAYTSDFIAVTRLNRDATRRESGNKKYDIYQLRYDSTKFILHEIYESKQAEGNHRRTTHYKKWREKVEPMMATQRTKYYEGGIPSGYQIIN